MIERKLFGSARHCWLTVNFLWIFDLVERKKTDTERYWKFVVIVENYMGKLRWNVCGSTITSLPRSLDNWCWYLKCWLYATGKMFQTNTESIYNGCDDEFGDRKQLAPFRNDDRIEHFFRSFKLKKIFKIIFSWLLRLS